MRINVHERLQEKWLRKKSEQKQMQDDSSSFHPSFSIDDVEGYTTYFKEHGYVVVRDALTEDEITQSIDEIWHHPVALASNPDIQRDDPSTWEDDNWPSPG
jgi:hypothetical protein